MPSRQRNVTSVVLNLLDENGSCWMFDCGEGTQHQILQAPIKLSKINKLFVSHLHGDHLFGVPGMLTSRSNQGGVDGFEIYGPRGIRQYVETSLELSESRLNYELRIVEFDKQGLYGDGNGSEDLGVERHGNDGGLEGPDPIVTFGGFPIYRDELFTVSAALLDHRIDSFGFRITEADRTGSLDVGKLKALGVPAGPLYGRLKQGHTVELPDGRRVNGAELVGPPIAGRVVAVLGDTRRCPQAEELAQSADVLVHEATFSRDKAELARQFYHSTAEDAAMTAQQAGAGELVLTHISSRYQEEGLDLLLNEARAIFPKTAIAHDFLEVEVHRK